MLKNRVFIFFLISFFVWVFLGNIVFYFSLIVSVLSIVMMILFIFLCYMKKYHLFLFIIALWFTFWIFYSGVNNYFIGNKEIFIEKFYEQNSTIIAEVKQLYKKSAHSYSYIIHTYSVDGVSLYGIDGLIYYPSNYVLEIGDIITFQWKIIKIDNFSDSFDYQKFLQSKNIFFQSFVNNVEIIDKIHISEWRQFIIDIREKMLEIVYNMYPKNEAIFLAWILIWAREDMPEDLSQNFNNSWLTHLVAVSGFNITIIIVFLWFLFQVFPIFIRTIIICISVIFFVLLVWDNVPVVRAWIMGLIWYFILISGRKWDSLSILLFTAFIMVLYNPLYLNYDTSFHLSFLAVFGLLYFQEFWTKVFYFLPRFFAIKESFILTMSALTTTLPIMLFTFWQVSIFAPLTNMLVWWIIPFAMLFGFLSIIWQIFSSTLWFIFWFINYFFLKYVVFIASFFWSLDFWIYKVDFWAYGVYLEILMFWILIFLILYFWQEKNPIK